MQPVTEISSSLIECAARSNNELFVVEGVSAANAINAVRDRCSQAVFPLQGKVPNAKRMPEERLLLNRHLADLLQCLHIQRRLETRFDSFRYEQITLIAESDADGVHASMLVLLFFQQYLPAIIDQGRLSLVRAPLYGFYCQDKCIQLAYSEKQAAHVSRMLAEQSSLVPQQRHFKGVASLGFDQRLQLLSHNCQSRRRITAESCAELCRWVN